LRPGPVILGDWGGTRLRLWLRAEGATLASHEGAGLLAARDDPAEVLRKGLEALGGQARHCPVVLCGMAGARGGLAEAPYIPCPGSVEEWTGAVVETSLGNRRVTILPGFSCRDDRGRSDVMRGEEAQVFGVLAAEPEASGRRTVVLPGTHSKWVAVEGRRIARFKTCPTGELFALLGGSSLAPGYAARPVDPDADGFAAGIDRAREDGALIASLFEARAAQLLDGRPAHWASDFLSGLLIGSEIAAMVEQLESAGPLLLVGSDELTRLYRVALERFGIDCRTANGETCALRGLEITYARLG
jgi:2-dehydro-3-deoxygalactonokinase